MNKNTINLITNSRRKITCAGLENSSAKLFPKNTVFVSTTATIGKIGLAGQEMSANQQITGIICGIKLEPRFLAYYFLHLGESELKKIGGKAVATHINQTNFRKVKIPLPPLSEQKKIVAYLDALSAKTRELQNLQTQTATDFSAIRHSILFQAFG
jgi:restriction endonuclease S subunit